MTRECAQVYFEETIYNVQQMSLLIRIKSINRNEKDKNKIKNHTQTLYYTV